MKDNQEFFTKMTNVRDILQRLTSRGVISEDLKEILIRLPNAAGRKEILVYYIIMYSTFAFKCYHTNVHGYVYEIEDNLAAEAV